jgi:transcriptional regulator with XRE-family HTH domain
MDAEYTADLIAEGRAAARTGRGRRIRKAARLSMADVARDLDISLDSVQRWELGVRQPRAERAAAYARLLRRLERFATTYPETETGAQESARHPNTPRQLECPDENSQ